MNVLVGCEFSGIVRDAFRAKGHNAYSCDLLPTEKPGPHFRCDVRDVLDYGWDLAIFHPPCTHLAVSGARWFSEKADEQQKALKFVRELMQCGIPKIALENPVSIISSKIRKPDQTIQPWQFGHGEVKATCFWLSGLPKLIPTKVVGYGWPRKNNRVHRESPGEDRWKNRSRTYAGIAKAMAEQWGCDDGTDAVAFGFVEEQEAAMTLDESRVFPHAIKILLASGSSRRTIILATDCFEICSWIDDNGPEMEHVAGPEDIPHTLEPGFYLWEGDIDCVQVRKGDDRYDDYVYEGSYRKIKAIDAEKFIGLKPPQEEEEEEG